MYLYREWQGQAHVKENYKNKQFGGCSLMVKLGVWFL